MGGLDIVPGKTETLQGGVGLKEGDERVFLIRVIDHSQLPVNGNIPKGQLPKFRPPTVNEGMNVGGKGGDAVYRQFFKVWTPSDEHIPKVARCRLLV